jgi:myo-inositol-1(or 4)-monophosphatase
VAETLEEVLTEADFLSINCRLTEATRGLIGRRQLHLCKRGVVIVNPAAAEVLDKQAVLDEFNKPVDERTVGVLILDMPFGQRRDARAFLADSDNAVLKERGVLFTPRMAGYTVETAVRAGTELAARLRRELEPSCALDESEIQLLCNDIVDLVRAAAAEAIGLREAGLAVSYKQDGSPVTAADEAAEAVVRDGLRARGYAFGFSGEESGPVISGDERVRAIIDGIDGTRNFRDQIFGWCVSVAITVDEEPLIGVVHEPHTGDTYCAIRGHGAFIRSLTGTRACRTPESFPRDFSFSVGSFRGSRNTATKTGIITDLKRLGGREREWGSVGLSLCAVARGGFGVFIQGNSYRHEHAAGVLIAREAGATVVLRQMPASERLDVIASHSSLSQPVSEIVETWMRQPPAQ